MCFIIQFVIMKSNRQSDTYKRNRFFWKIFGTWPGKTPNIYYKCFSFVFIMIITIVYNVILTVNLIYTPANIEAFIQEVIFFFSEVGVVAKIMMFVFMREKIIAIIKSTDCEEFQGSDDFTREIIDKSNSTYKLWWKVYAIISNFSFSTVVIFPLLFHVTLKRDLDLPVANYYFLSDDTKKEYFAYCFVYQSIGIYVHLMFNVSVDSFIAGLILLGITQLKVLNYNFSQMKLDRDETAHDYEHMKIVKLNKLLRHYNIIVKFCSDVQDLISLVMFVQFFMASLIICVSMCGLLLVSSTSVLYGIFSYLCAMTMQIFVPGWLGTQLGYESQELMNAAYSSDWIPQSESYKRSLLMFIGRANNPITITALKMFPLSLGTFLSIMKMAYSFFALLRKLQDRQV